MFFSSTDLGSRTKDSRIKILPPIPRTGWKAPKEFPNLDSAIAISIDVETKEPDFDHGPGWGRSRGHIVGLAVGAIDQLGNQGQWYFPMRHTLMPEDNLDPFHVLNWSKQYIENPYLPKVGANLIYDVGWLTEEGVAVAGDLHDVQFAEALLDNDAKVALQVLATKYLGQSKATDLMYDWIIQAYKPKARAERGEIWRTPPCLVGFYGEGDASLPLQIIQKQFPLLHAEGLWDVYRMECDLIYLLVEMRRAGVTVDLGKAESLYEQLTQELKVLQFKLDQLVGKHVESVLSPEDVGILFDKFGIPYTRTPTGKPSITDAFLDSVDHPLTEYVSAIRKTQKIRDVFIDSYILKSHVNGKVHGQFHPLRGEAGGTVTGRFSCVAADTLIDTSKGEVRIADLKIGDNVLTHKKRFRPVTALWRKGTEAMLRLTFSNSYVLTCTISHKMLLSNNEWISVEDLADAYFKTMEITTREYIKNCESLPKQPYNNYRTNSKKNGCVLLEHTPRYRTEHTRSRKKSFKKTTLLLIKDRRQKPHVWQSRRSAPQLDRYHRRRLWLFNHNTPRKAPVCSQNYYGTSIEFRNSTRNIRSTSYRQQSKKQCIRQSSSSNENRSHTNTLSSNENDNKSVVIINIEFSGYHEVFDITVEEDASYSTCGTFSHNSSSPNLQNIAKSTELGMKVRAMFRHDYDHVGSGAGDYSQIEYRMLVHFGVGKGIEQVRDQYINDPSTDYHTLTQKLVKDVTGIYIPRSAKECAELGMKKGIKTINFGLLYGMMEGKLGADLGLDRSKTKEVFQGYHGGAPYVKATMDAVQQEVYDYGYITTISGRRTRFNLWEPKNRVWGEERKVYTLDKAVEIYGSDIQRALAYKGVNYKLQGSAADVLKYAMRRCWKDGVYKIIGVPRLTVHDENFHSIRDFSPEQAEGYRHMIWCMENTTPLKIPVRFDWGLGNSWGEC